MNTIKRYWIIEITLFLIAIAAFGFALFGSGGAVNAGQQPTPTLVSAETELALAQEQAGNQPTEFIEDEEDMTSDEDESEDDEGNTSDEAEFDLIVAAAELLQVDVETLEADLATGKSLATIASERGADIQQLITALVEQEQAFIDSLAQSGAIDSTEAEEWRSEVATFTPFFVENGYLEPEVIAANLLGIDPEVLWEALDGGQTVAELAAAQNVDVETIIAAAMAEEERLIGYLLANEVVDSADAAEWRTEHAAYLTELINTPLDESR